MDNLGPLYVGRVYLKMFGVRSRKAQGLHCVFYDFLRHVIVQLLGCGDVNPVDCV